MKFDNTEVWGFEHALRGMRNPKNSWNKSDSFNCLDKEGEHCSKFCKNYDTEKCFMYGSYRLATPFVIGDNDMKLAQTLIKAGSEHRKFMRQIFVSVDITAPLFWWKEFDTYKVGTVRNSCSTMHKIHVKEFNYDDFTHLGIDECGEMLANDFKAYIEVLECLRNEFNDTKEKKYWRALIEMLPDGFNMKATVTFDYENLLGMCSKGQRRFHKLSEWSGIDYPTEPSFIVWARTLPYAQELIFIDELESK